jgi:hypothetical protein
MWFTGKNTNRKLCARLTLRHVPWLKVFRDFSPSCKTNTRVYLSKTGQGPYSWISELCFSIFYLCQLCCTMYCLSVNVYRTVLLPPGGNPIAVKYITSYHTIYYIILCHISYIYHIVSSHYIVSYHIIYYHIISQTSKAIKFLTALPHARRTPQNETTVKSHSTVCAAPHENCVSLTLYRNTLYYVMSLSYFVGRVS